MRSSQRCSYPICQLPSQSARCSGGDSLMPTIAPNQRTGIVLSVDGQQNFPLQEVMK